MRKNFAGQKLTLFAYDSTTSLPKTGDAANITAYTSKDNGAVTALADTSVTEQSASDAAGFYLVDLSQAETNADKLQFTAKSATSGIIVLAVPAVFYTHASPISPARILTGHTWKFDSPTQVTAPNTITELAGFDDMLFEMDLSTTLANNAGVLTINSVTIANIVGATEPTVVSSARRTDFKAVHITLDGVSASPATYLATVNYTTSDSQTISRSGRLVVQ